MGWPRPACAAPPCRRRRCRRHWQRGGGGRGPADCSLRVAHRHQPCSSRGEQLQCGWGAMRLACRNPRLHGTHTSLSSALPPPSTQAAHVEQHAFVAEPAPAPSVLGSLLHTRGTGPFGPTAPMGGADGSGWVWAAAVLLAARLGRLTAQEARLDVRKLQASGRMERGVYAGAGGCELWALQQLLRAAAKRLR